MPKLLLQLIETFTEGGIIGTALSNFGSTHGPNFLLERIPIRLGSDPVLLWSVIDDIHNIAPRFRTRRLREVFFGPFGFGVPCLGNWRNSAVGEHFLVLFVKLIRRKSICFTHPLLGLDEFEKIVMIQELLAGNFRL